MNTYLHHSSQGATLAIAVDGSLYEALRQSLLAAVAQDPEESPGGAKAEGRAISGGIDAAFSGFLASHQDHILGVACRLLHNRDDAFDVLQEVACILYRHWERLDPSQNIDGWLYRVTVNECHRWLRQRARQPQTEGSQPLPEQSQGPSQEGHVRTRQFQAFLGEAMAILSEQERLAFVLRDMEHRPGRELAALMDCQPATARGYYFNARKKLAAHIEQHGPEWLALLGGRS